MKATFIILTILIALASCQQNIVSITSPLSNSQYTAGEKLIISWINPTVQTIPSITLVNGPATALQPVSTIAQNVDANSGSYSWSIPADITPGRYALQLGTSPSISYSGFFTINAANGGSSNGGASPTSSGATPSGNSTATSTTAASGSTTSSAQVTSSTPVSSTVSTQPTTAASSVTTTAPSPTNAPNSANKKTTGILLIAAMVAAIALI